MQKYILSATVALVALGSTFVSVSSASAYPTYRNTLPAPLYVSPMERKPSFMNRDYYRTNSTGTTCYDRNGYKVFGRTCR